MDERLWSILSIDALSKAGVSRKQSTSERAVGLAASIALQ
jgi:hypothetical protein